ncbi:hypothetical protein [Kitasatospora sp. NPDC059827]
MGAAERLGEALRRLAGLPLAVVKLPAGYGIAPAPDPALPEATSTEGFR